MSKSKSNKGGGNSALSYKGSGEIRKEINPVESLKKVKIPKKPEPEVEVSLVERGVLFFVNNKRAIGNAMLIGADYVKDYTVGHKVLKFLGRILSGSKK